MRKRVRTILIYSISRDDILAKLNDMLKSLIEQQNQALVFLWHMAPHIIDLGISV